MARTSYNYVADVILLVNIIKTGFVQYTLIKMLGS